MYAAFNDFFDTIRKLHTNLNDFVIKASPANTYFFKVNNRNTRIWCEICSKLTIKTPERRLNVIVVFLSLILNIFYTFF